MAKKAKRPVPQSREEASIKSFLDMIAPSVVSFMPDHFICGNTFRCVWALREYPTSTDEQATVPHNDGFPAAVNGQVDLQLEVFVFFQRTNQSFEFFIYL